jgi:UDP-N-acetylmuramate--alanine ligase
MSAFRKFIGLIPNNGYLFINVDNENTVKASEVAKCNIITFGLDGNADYRADNIQYDKLGHPSFDIYHKGKLLGNIQLSVPGLHNVYNALASIAISHNAGISIDSIKKSLTVFKGTHRRFDIKGSINNITVVDDYAHHPTEIKATLSAAKKFPHKRIWCVFQPHTYSRTKTLFKDFSKAFYDADEVIVTDIYAAREKDTGEISSIDLVNGINDNSGNAIYETEFEDIANIIAEDAEPGDIILTVGAGSITELGEMILNKLQ